MSGVYDEVDGFVLASRLQAAFPSAGDYDDEPGRTRTSAGSEEERIRRTQQERLASSPSPPKRTYCAHLQPCLACNPERASSEPAATPTETAAPVAARRRPKTKSHAISTVADAPHARSPSPTVADPVDALATLLEACKTDDERATLIAAAPESVRRRLTLRLGYLHFVESTRVEGEELGRKLAAFGEALEDACTDAERLALIRAADPSLVAEWRWRSNAAGEDWRKRYMSAVT